MVEKERTEKRTDQLQKDGHQFRQRGCMQDQRTRKDGRHQFWTGEEAVS